jgi:hypothetical protein
MTERLLLLNSSTIPRKQNVATLHFNLEIVGFKKRIDDYFGLMIEDIPMHKIMNIIGPPDFFANIFVDPNSFTPDWQQKMISCSSGGKLCNSIILHYIKNYDERFLGTSLYQPLLILVPIETMIKLLDKNDALNNLWDYIFLAARNGLSKLVKIFFTATVNDAKISSSDELYDSSTRCCGLFVLGGLDELTSNALEEALRMEFDKPYLKRVQRLRKFYTTGLTDVNLNEKELIRLTE